MTSCLLHSVFFFFNDTATTEIYTLSLHDALPIFSRQIGAMQLRAQVAKEILANLQRVEHLLDRKSTRLNSSHQIISYAVFCLKKKNKNTHTTTQQQYAPLTQRSDHNTHTRLAAHH